MAQEITLANGADVCTLDPDLFWSDEFDWSPVNQSIARSITGSLLIDHTVRVGGRPITLQPADDSSGWLKMTRSVVDKLKAWEADPALTLTLALRGVTRQVIFLRDGAKPIETKPVIYVADPLPGGFGDHFFVTLRFLEV